MNFNVESDLDYEESDLCSLVPEEEFVSQNNNNQNLNLTEGDDQFLEINLRNEENFFTNEVSLLSNTEKEKPLEVNQPDVEQKNMKLHDLTKNNKIDNNKKFEEKKEQKIKKEYKKTEVKFKKSSCKISKKQSQPLCRFKKNNRTAKTGWNPNSLKFQINGGCTYSENNLKRKNLNSNFKLFIGSNGNKPENKVKSEGNVSTIFGESILSKTIKDFNELKKKMRLKRFMIDDPEYEEKIQEKKTEWSNFKDYFQKPDEQRLTNENVLDTKKKHGSAVNTTFDSLANLPKLKINKKFLMKKENPFDTNAQCNQEDKKSISLSSQHHVEKKVETTPPKLTINKQFLMNKTNPFDSNVLFNQENSKSVSLATQHQEEKKAEWIRNSMLNENIEIEQNSITKSDISSPSFSFCRNDLKIAKNESSGNTTIVRTISKTFDELVPSKSKCETHLGVELLKPMSSHVRRVYFPMKNAFLKKSEENAQTQEKHYLSGCIVKLLNIPETTTAEDIKSFCSPVGNPLEFKLNLPKENSVVIRFGNPTEAENFHSLYHGQKMNKYFLSVIVI